jgi:hypothetical protein
MDFDNELAVHLDGTGLQLADLAENALSGAWMIFHANTRPPHHAYAFSAPQGQCISLGDDWEMFGTAICNGKPDPFGVSFDSKSDTLTWTLFTRPVSFSGISKPGSPWVVRSEIISGRIFAKLTADVPWQPRETLMAGAFIIGNARVT